MIFFMRYNFDTDNIFHRYKDLLLEQVSEEQLTMSEKEFKAFEEKLVRAKFRLFKGWPFFGLMLQKLKTVPIVPRSAAAVSRRTESLESTNIETMAVDNDGNIYINVDFTMKTLSDDEVIGVLAHEVMHIATHTFPRQRGRNMEIWNFATDYIMNRDLLELGLKLPKMGLIPQNQGGKWVIEIPDASKMKVSNKGNISGVNMTKIDISEMTAEELYDILLKNNPPGQCLQKIRQIISEKGEMDKHLTPEEAQQVQGSGVPSGDPVYTKNTGEGLSPQQKDSLNKSRVQEAAQQAQEQAKQRGTEPGMPRSFDKRLLSAKVNWKQLLKNFIVGATVVKKDYSRESRKHAGGDFFRPRVYTVKNELQAVIAIDTSGSITDPVLRTFLGEILNIIKSYRSYKISMTVLLWDTQVGDAFEIDTSKMNMSAIEKGLMNMKAHGGGTELSCVKKYLDKKYQGKPIKGGLIVFTDGAVEDNPQLPNAPKKMFFITMDGTDEILKKYGPTYFIDVPHA